MALRCREHGQICCSVAALKLELFKLLKRWANELFPVHAQDGEHFLDFDGIGLDLFGVINYSVHLVGWVKMKNTLKKYWVPRRASTKMSFPGMLDDTVGGSLASGEKPMDCIVRECEEEISLNPAFTRANIQSCGTASYYMTQTDLSNRGCQPQVQYLYEMELAGDVTPKIRDGEVGEILLMTLEEVQTALADEKIQTQLHHDLALLSHPTWTADCRE